LGIPILLDRIVQRAMLMAMEPIWESDFHVGSYGFRSERGKNGNRYGNSQRNRLFPTVRDESLAPAPISSSPPQALGSATKAAPA